VYQRWQLFTGVLAGESLGSRDDGLRGRKPVSVKDDKNINWEWVGGCLWWCITLIKMSHIQKESGEPLTV
jgi:hypothetical protein